MKWTLSDINRHNAKLRGDNPLPGRTIKKTGTGKEGRKAEPEEVFYEPKEDKRMIHTMVIGLDTGVNTGFAVWDKSKKQLIEVETLMIHEAMERIVKLSDGYSVRVRFEDARLRKWFGKAGREQLQGAGSVKRDAKIIEDFCKDKGIAFEAVAPKNNKTKTTAESFKKLTGWQNRTSVHARDAAMLCFGF